MAIQTEEALRERFKAMDLDGSGEIGMAEFIKFAFKEAYQRSGARVVELLKERDVADGSGVEVLLDPSRCAACRAACSLASASLAAITDVTRSRCASSVPRWRARRGVAQCCGSCAR
jgi:hypothetical protein